jgi:lipoprotein-anchoring transpeptidase ErfK/SrfK
MPWTYHQSNGLLEYRWEHNVHHVGRGYSGAPGAVNNSHMEAIHFKGPIPRGHYHIGPMGQRPNLKWPVMTLTPVGHKAHNRTHLLIHGDNQNGNQTGSNGCIILEKAIRLRIGHSHDHILQVI